LFIGYHNLGIFQKKVDFPDLSPANLFQRLLVERKGGMCYEICSLLYHSLKKLDFNVEMVRTWVLNNKPYDPQ